jgi:diguanylate cyclase (GGDEF)-like protein
VEPRVTPQSAFPGDRSGAAHEDATLHFSDINIDYGYAAGDKILQELANRFRRFMRSYDLIGRCGEDEFLIALPGCTSEQALAMALRVRKTILQKPFVAGRDMLTLTASMGIAQSKGRFSPRGAGGGARSGRG